ncbi:MAG: nucleotide exchange factor GrpE [Planctomycetota bacterium]|nr:nucleotide exchange factor GrpE [Planctomycetota bacterium]
MNEPQAACQPTSDSPAAPASPASEAPASEAPPAPDSDPLAARVQELEAQVAAWRERCMRQQADFENARRRLRREADEAAQRAVARFVRPILDQLDNLERALASAKPEAFAEFAQGVTMIRENLRGSLAAAGIVPVACEGLFDPAVHEVLAEEERPGVPRGTILRVHRSGWRLGEHLVRSAQVIVAK